MITKVIGTASGFYDVARYLKLNRETGEARDTGFCVGYNVAPEPMAAAREMAAVSRERLMHQPCLHVVLSPATSGQDGERMSPAQLDDLVGDLLRERGWQQYQVLAVEHLDTQHQHVHLMLNRAHPFERGQRIDPYHLYNDLRRWARSYEARRAGVALHGAHPEGARAARDRPPAQREQRPDLQPSGDGQPRLTDLRGLAKETGLERELASLAAFDRLAHEQEIAQAMLRADKTGAVLLSDDQRHLLQQTAHELDLLLARHQRLLRQEGATLPENLSIRRDPKAPPHDVVQRVASNYRHLLSEARPYWRHAEAAVRDMKDLAVLRGHDSVVRAIRREPDAFGERTTAKITDVDARRLGEAYRRYEVARRQYVARISSRLGLPREPESPAPGGLGEAAGRLAQAERLYVKDVASRLLEERVAAVGEELRVVTDQAKQASTTVRERAYHYLRTALTTTYKDPAEAFRSLEAYHARGQVGLVVRHPDLLGRLHRTGLMQRVQGDTPRRRAADIARRYSLYVDGPETRRRLAAAATRIERLQERLQVLGFVQERVGTSQDVREGYEKVHKGLTADERLRLGIRLEHLPGAEVRRRSEQLIGRALRAHPGVVRPDHVRGLATPGKAADLAMGKAAGEIGRKLSLRRPLHLAMKATQLTRATTSSLTMVYRAARTFFER